MPARLPGPGQEELRGTRRKPGKAAFPPPIRGVGKGALAPRTFSCRLDSVLTSIYIQMDGHVSPNPSSTFRVLRNLLLVGGPLCVLLGDEVLNPLGQLPAPVLVRVWPGLCGAEVAFVLEGLGRRAVGDPMLLELVEVWGAVKDHNNGGQRTRRLVSDSNRAGLNSRACRRTRLAMDFGSSSMCGILALSTRTGMTPHIPGQCSTDLNAHKVVRVIKPEPAVLIGDSQPLVTHQHDHHVAGPYSPGNRLHEVVTQLDGVDVLGDLARHRNGQQAGRTTTRPGKLSLPAGN